MPHYHFPGHPAFLDAAAAEIGRPEAALAARRDSTLGGITILCSQAAECDPQHVASILAEAEELTDRLRVALRAAELILAHVQNGRASKSIAANSPTTLTPGVTTGRISRRTT